MHDLHEMAKQRGYRIVEEYTDMISGAKARRPGLDAMMRDEPNDYPSGAR
jgi:DNA invertase Pin-like site-specific DNA recombinase